MCDRSIEGDKAEYAHIMVDFLHTFFSYGARWLG